MISTVAVGMDGSDTAAEALRMASEVARRFDAEIVVLSAFDESRSGDASRDREDQWAYSPATRLREHLSRAEEDLRADGLTARTMVGEGEAGEVLVRLAEECDADILVVGNKGMQRRVLGSVPNTVTHKASCSVMVVKTT